MKTSKIILILIAVISLGSCKSDDDGPAQPQLVNAEFAGTYSLNFLESTEIETRIVNGGTIITRTVIKGDSFTNSDFVFSENGTYTSNVSFRVAETVTVTGNPPQTNNYVVTEQDSGNYTLDQNNQTITLDGEVTNVISFTTNALRVRLSDTEVDGETTIEYTEELRFDRL